MFQTFSLSSLKRSWLAGAVAVVACLGLSATPASAEFQEGDFEIRLSGFAQNDVNFSGVVINLNGMLGWFMNDQLEFGIRQDINFSDVFTSTLNAGTAVFVNFHFGGPNQPWQPFIGANLGYVYGDGVRDTFVAGPEVGIKWFMDETWFLFGQIEYQFFFRDVGEADDRLNDGVFNYRIGLGAILRNGRGGLF